MKLNRIAVAVALAMAGGSALGQQATPVTAESSIQIYGHLDLSIDTLTKGIAGKTNAGGSTATGKLGYQDDISSNLSYVGIRGSRELVPGGLRGCFSSRRKSTSQRPRALAF